MAVVIPGTMTVFTVEAGEDLEIDVVDQNGGLVDTTKVTVAGVTQSIGGTTYAPLTSAVASVTAGFITGNAPGAGAVRFTYHDGMSSVFVDVAVIVPSEVTQIGVRRTPSSLF